MMNINIHSWPLREELNNTYKVFLSKIGLRYEDDLERIALMTDEEFNIIGTGGRAGHILKVFGVDPGIEDTGAFASIMSALLNDAASDGVSRLFLCTKPANQRMLSSMGFHPVIETKDAIMMEDRKDGFTDFLSAIPKYEGECGAIVMNGNPFTKGHRHLVEYALDNCDHLYLFVVSEDASLFSTEERYNMIKAGTEDLDNCHVFMSDAYLVSRSTFPAYFIKDEVAAEGVKSDLDIELFGARIAPALNITKRFVGEEPFSSVTKEYNHRMKELLPKKGIELIEIPRLESLEYGIISGSKVRSFMEEGNLDAVKELVVPSTYEEILRKLGRHS